MNVKYLWSAASLGLMLHTGCGDDSGAAPGGTGGAGGKGGTGAKGGTGGATAGGLATAGASGSAGTPSITDVITMLTTPMCDATATSEVSCGSTTCPELASTAASTCTINCCATDGRCGTRSADMRIQQLLGTTCNPPATPDERCPSTALAGTSFAGCCDGQGNCGQLLGPLCLPGTVARACDAPPDSLTDAGL